MHHSTFWRKQKGRTHYEDIKFVSFSQQNCLFTTICIWTVRNKGYLFCVFPIAATLVNIFCDVASDISPEFGNRDTEKFRAQEKSFCKAVSQPARIWIVTRTNAMLRRDPLSRGSVRSPFPLMLYITLPHAYLVFALSLSPGCKLLKFVKQAACWLHCFKQLCFGI